MRNYNLNNFERGVKESESIIFNTANENNTKKVDRLLITYQPSSIREGPRSIIPPKNKKNKTYRIQKRHKTTIPRNRS